MCLVLLPTVIPLELLPLSALSLLPRSCMLIAKTVEYVPMNVVFSWICSSDPMRGNDRRGSTWAPCALNPRLVRAPHSLFARKCFSYPDHLHLPSPAHICELPPPTRRQHRFDFCAVVIHAGMQNCNRNTVVWTQSTRTRITIQLNFCMVDLTEHPRKHRSSGKLLSVVTARVVCLVSSLRSFNSHESP